MAPRAITATFTVYSYNQCAALSDRIDSENQFTTVPENSPTDIKPLSLALMSLSTSNTSTDELIILTHIGIIRKGQRVATNQVRIKATDVIRLPDIGLSELLSHIPLKLRESAQNAFGIGFQKVPPKTGEALYLALLETCPDQEAAIGRLLTKLYTPPVVKGSARGEDTAVEKDALGICLDIFGIDRSEVLRNWQVTDGSLGTSFLNGLVEYSAYEDDIISNDLHNIPGWNAVSETVSGIVEFQNDDGEKLTVINANRKPLEKALGVDLIYFHRKYEAFTLVQYKMMDQKAEKSNEQYYNPNNKSHHEELGRMGKLYELICQDVKSDELTDYRLTDCPIFFKVCKKLQLKAEDTSIAAGAYIPLNQWNILLKDPSLNGPKGGVQIGFHTLNKRYIGTQTFVELIQKGFLGTQRISSKKIGAFIEDAISKGHSIMYAIDNKKDKPVQITRRTIADDFDKKY